MKENEKSRWKRWSSVAVVSAVALLLVVGVIGDFGMQIRKKELDRTAQTLSGLAVQGAAVAENKIEQAKGLLNAQAETMRYREDIQSNEVMNCLEKMVADKENGIVRAGSVNAAGFAQITDGRRRYVGEKDFFLHAMAGEEYVSSIVIEVRREDSFSVSVPVFDKSGQAKGVLYAVIEARNFKLYTDAGKETEAEEQYIHIIDKEGNYIVRTDEKNGGQSVTNIFALLKKEKLSVPIEQIQKDIAQGKVVTTQTENGENSKYVYFAPMNINNWCVVTVMKGSAVEKHVSYSKQATIWLMIKIVAILAVAAGFYYRKLLQEKKKTEKLNRELLVKDEIFKITTAEIGDFVFAYDTETRRLEFMNYDASKIKIPQVVEDFPNTFSKYLIEGTQAHAEVKRLLDAIENGGKNLSGEIIYKMEDHYTVFQIRLTGIEDEGGRLIRMVGTLKDVTETKKYLERAGLDPLTKVFNREEGTRRINNVMKQKKDSTHAFVFIDIDNFKRVNDTLGHLTGDKVLVDCVETMKHHVHRGDIICRLGGDEFAVFLVDMPREAVDANITSFLKQLDRTYEGEGGSVRVSASIGVAMVPECGTDFQTLYELADGVLYKAKESGKNTYEMVHVKEE